MTPAHAARLLLAWRGRRGSLARLSALYAKRDEMEDGPASIASGWAQGHGGGLPSDPTARDAERSIKLCGRWDRDIDSLESELCDIRDALAECPHGAWLEAYYLTEQDDVTWDSLAADAGVDGRTIYRWREEGLEWMAEHPAMWRAM